VRLLPQKEQNFEASSGRWFSFRSVKLRNRQSYLLIKVLLFIIINHKIRIVKTFFWIIRH